MEPISHGMESVYARQEQLLTALLTGVNSMAAALERLAVAAEGRRPSGAKALERAALLALYQAGENPNVQAIAESLGLPDAKRLYEIRSFRDAVRKLRPPGYRRGLRKGHRKACGDVEAYDE